MVDDEVGRGGSVAVSLNGGGTPVNFNGSGRIM
jgi:hypothetical protein